MTGKHLSHAHVYTAARYARLAVHLIKKTADIIRPGLAQAVETCLEDHRSLFVHRPPHEQRARD
jgi:hypothetical protein